jgi:hypothetical protein
MRANTLPLSRRVFLKETAQGALVFGVGARSWVSGEITDQSSSPVGSRISYYCNGEIHVNIPGQPEGKPVTTGHWDFKPSWSKNGDMLVFFRRLKNDPDVSRWITAICIINIDGTGFHQISDGTFTDFNPTWTRDGKNTPLWNRKNPSTGNYQIMASQLGAKPGEEVALTDATYSSWVHSSLSDGRLLVASAPPKLGRGYYLMTPKPGGEPKFERIHCELARWGVLDRVSLSPDEKKVCFEFQPWLIGKGMIGRTLYIADFDVAKREISNPKPFANEERKPLWFGYPRWIDGGRAIVFHAGKPGNCQLFVYRLGDGTTQQVSTNPKADYRYPHGEDIPC